MSARDWFRIEDWHLFEISVRVTLLAISIAVLLLLAW